MNQLKLSIECDELVIELNVIRNIIFVKSAFKFIFSAIALFNIIFLKKICSQ